MTDVTHQRKGADMIDSEREPHAHHTHHLTPLQWTALKRSVVQRAHAERARMLRSVVIAVVAALRHGWRGLRERQQACDQLRSMSDYELRDIGVTRANIDAVTRHGNDDATQAAPQRSHQNWRAMMSKAYWIVRVSVRDETRYPDYLAAAKPAFDKFGARFIVRGGAFETMEGDARDRNVVVEFADRATATACYRSPEYEAAKAIRRKYAEADFIIIDGA
ncbi:DUF1330 domain-containing protein [Tardiphaga sp. P9-11]|jgi:uncharacterized protein (DUF1330 family)/uncharacterized protein YjiS (DUF1127 family)|nr:DUF1330 domain-containing protein [Tardiphaga sp. P9-11]